MHRIRFYNADSVPFYDLCGLLIYFWPHRSLADCAFRPCYPNPHSLMPLIIRQTFVTLSMDYNVWTFNIFLIDTERYIGLF